MEKVFDKLKCSKIFNIMVVMSILATAIIDGAQTYDLPIDIYTSIILIDNVIIIWFVLEMIIRIFSFENKLDFFRSPWNCIDAVIIAFCLLPSSAMGNILIFRIIRVFRVLRLLVIIPKLRVLFSSLTKSIPQLSYVGVMMFIIFYVFAAFGSHYFSQINEELWGNIGISMLTLFRVMTFEDWTDVMYEVMEVYSIGWLYFIIFIFLTAFAFLNMVIAILSNGLSEESHPNTDDDLTVIKNQLSDIQSKLEQINK
ncbi:ion transporter [Aliivibrio sp. EL58]|uniref:ion transporter n=1 Tax=Aliivibrio sp. EL58 TaxID=2107582 RepID=UPI000EFBE99D|nr:ion transporter [Aliivibrio sp. EL58]